MTKPKPKPPAKRTPKPAPILRTLGERFDVLQAYLSAYEQETAGKIELAQNIAEAAKHDVKSLRVVLDMQTKADAAIQCIQDDQSKELRQLAGELRRIAGMFEQHTVNDVRRQSELAGRIDVLEQQAIAVDENNAERLVRAEEIAADVNSSFATMTCLFLICVAIAGVALVASAF